MKLQTALIHEDNVHHESGAVTSPIVLATTFERGDDGLSYPGGYMYGRYDNPNRHALEAKLCKMEKGAASIAFSSGLAAATAVLHSLQSGDHVLLADDTYFSIRKLLDVMYSKFGIGYTLVDMCNTELVKSCIQENTKLIWMESPSNPLIKVTDIAAVVGIAKAHACVTIVDNTWATPMLTNPLSLGVDIVMHSTTKYIGGHSDVLSGALVVKEKNERYEYLRSHQKLTGSVPSPFDCWLLCRSLTTFAARMPIHCNNAMRLAQYLEKHDKVTSVIYPGLESHPQHEVAKRQMINGFGGMISILVKGGKEKALELCGQLQLFAHATSLGGVESLIEHRESVEGLGTRTPDNLLRISVGIEDIEDLIDDFSQALSKI